MGEVKRITVVDDNPAIQDAVRMILEIKGYEVTGMERGEPLLLADLEHPDLFILDNQLPGISGLDVCRYLKGQDATRHIPILILSASPDLGRTAKAACADEFLEKPFKIKILREMVERLLTGTTV